MNAAQLPKYHVNRKKWEAARRARGLPCDEAALDALKQKTIGRVCSSKKMRDPEMTKMLQAFLAEAEPANFSAQFDLAGSDERAKQIEAERMAAMRTQIAKLATACEITGGDAGLEQYFRHWFGERQLATLKDGELRQLVGMLKARAAQLAPKEGQPF